MTASSTAISATEDLGLAEVGYPEEGAPSRLNKNRRGGGKTFAELAILIGPALLIFIGFVILPVLYAAYCGFFKWNGYGAPTNFISWTNYKTVLSDPYFWRAVSHNVEIAVLSLVIQGPLALVMALLLNRKMKGRGLLRVLLFIPYVIAEAIVGVGWRLLLGSGQKGGAVNALLASVGLNGLQTYWLGKATAIFTLVVICTWKYVGFAVILFLAGMQGIPEELSEAAAVDGASFWRTQWHITVPLLAPTLRIWAFLSIIGSMQLFDLVYVIWGKVAWLNNVETMAAYMVRTGRDTQLFGYGNAVAVIMFIISLVIALLYQRFVLSRDTAGALTEGGR